MKQCPNCNNEIREDLDFCSQECAKQFKEKNKLAKKSSKTESNNEDKTKENNVRLILEFIGINQKDVRKDCYRHWEKFILFCMKNSGQKWNSIRLRLRSWIGIDFRYLDDYILACEEWGIIKKDNEDNLIFKGLPEKEVSP